MALDAGSMENALYSSLSNTNDRQDKPTTPPHIMKMFVSGLINMLKAGTVSHLPGGVTGTGVPVNSPPPIPPPGSFMDGAATGGKIAGLVSSTMATTFADAINETIDASYHATVTSNVNSYCAMLATYLMTNGNVIFDTGKITGSCTAMQPIGTYPGAPGILAGGAGTDGHVTGYNSSDLANLMRDALKFPQMPPDMQPFHDAMLNYIMDHMVVTYAVGSVVGNFSNIPYPIPLTGGAGSGGIIS